MICVALSGVYVLIAIGAVMMFVGFLGCYGAIQESQCLLGTVGFTQLILFILHASNRFTIHLQKPFTRTMVYLLKTIEFCMNCLLILMKYT